MYNTDVNENTIYRIVSGIKFKQLKTDIRFYRKLGYTLHNGTACNVWGKDVIFHQILIKPEMREKDDKQRYFRSR